MRLRWKDKVAHSDDSQLAAWPKKKKDYILGFWVVILNQPDESVAQISKHQ